MRTTTLSEILEGFAPAQPEKQSSTTLTLWLPVKEKARYDRLQEKSGRRFSRKVRETIIALIDVAEEQLA